MTDHPLPPSISAYYDAAARTDTDAIVRCFTEDALVIDEGEEFRGSAGVRRWREQRADVYQYTTDIREVVTHPPEHDLEVYEVHVHLEGNFPGGEVDLANRFALRGGLIARLRTGG